MSSADSLEAALRATEPGVRLVSARHLLQLLYYLRDRDAAVPANPDLPLWVSQADLAAADVFPAGVVGGPEPRLLLISKPDDRLWGDLPQPELLRAYWRVLFQAAVMAVIDRKLADGSLTAVRCLEKLMRLGAPAAREVRYVLEADHLADPGADDAERYRIFAAVYLDLHHFTPAAVADVFPSLPPGDTVPAILAEDVDARSLLLRTRPAGAADPPPEPPPDAAWADPDPADAGASVEPPSGSAGAIETQAAEAEARGNFVRAAILRTQAAAVAGRENRVRTGTGGRQALGKLVRALAEVLHWDEPTQREWAQALFPLLDPASRGRWPRAARCLYELQKIPAELSREVYAVDLVEVLRTLGRRPLRRPLPYARPVRLLMRLRAAHRQLLRTDLTDRDRVRLDRLFHHELHRAEHEIRHSLGPVITTALTDAGLRPPDRVEEVARDKLVAELLDRVCERGHLRIGDLRDALARNQFKMADLAGPAEFFGGDPLLRADTRLAYALDGVYRRGEFYLRWLQRFSALFFGTPPGRVLALYLIAPFLAAFVAVVAADELIHLGGSAYRAVARAVRPKPAPPSAPAQTPPQPPPPETKESPPPQPAAAGAAEDFGDGIGGLGNLDEEPAPKLEPDDDDDGFFGFPGAVFNRLPGVEAVRQATSAPPHDLGKPREGAEAKGKHKTLSVNWWVVGGLAAFLFLMFHVPPFRRLVLTLIGSLWQLVKLVLYDLPMGVWRSGPVKAVRRNRGFVLLHRHFWAPLLLSAVALGILFVAGVRPAFLLRWGWVLPVGLGVLYNTPFGWMLQDRLAEMLADWWRVVRVNLIPGLIRWFLYVFGLLAGWFERRLYEVDEWLRYRTGDSESSVVLKAAVGLLWFPFAYVARFVFYVLFEPQVNPVKHFPVVTVGHKLVWPTLPTVAEAIGWVPATFLINGCPGVFGFIAWELMANWKLYRANRPARLRPAVIGSHGETMRGLLRPGFHSGTVPRVYRKIRHDVRVDGKKAAARHHHDLDHVAEGVHRFAERELVPLLRGSADWGGLKVEVAAVHFGCQRAVVELAVPEGGSDPLTLAFENRRGQIEAVVALPAWFERLTPGQRAVFIAAMRGLLDRAAATDFDGRERDPDAAPGGTGPLTDLARPYLRADWEKRWGPALAVKEG